MNILFVFMAAAMLAVLASLAIGLVVMAKGGETSKKYSNKLMKARIVLQGIALLLFVFILMTQGK